MKKNLIFSIVACFLAIGTAKADRMITPTNPYPTAVSESGTFRITIFVESETDPTVTKVVVTQAPFVADGNLIFPTTVYWSGTYNWGGTTGIIAYDFSAGIPITHIDGTCLNANYNGSTAEGIQKRSLLQSVTIPEGYVNIGGFLSTGVTSVSLPSSLKTISNTAFASCTSLAIITLPEGLEVVGNGAFQNCSTLNNIVLPETLTQIQGSAFYNCTSLTSINIPASIVRSNLTTFVPIGASAFQDCTSLHTVYWNSPDQYNNIGHSIFRGCTALQNVIVGENVETIPEYLFKDNTSITNVVLPNVKTIYESAFQGCTGITKINFPNTLEEIGYAAFMNCTGLQELDIPSSVNRFVSITFAGCTGLQQIKVHWETPLGVPANSFNVIPNKNTISLIVPRGTKSLYQAADVWKDFRIIEDNEPSVTATANDAVISWYSEPTATAYTLSVFTDEAHTQLFGEYNLNAAGVQPSPNLPSFENLEGLRATVGDLSYTVQGLSTETPYYYTLKVVKNTDTIATYAGSFATTNGTAIAEVQSDKELQIYVSGDELRLINFPSFGNLESLNVAIYDIAGCSARAYCIRPNETINVGTFPAGVYIVRVGNQTGKFIKK